MSAVTTSLPGMTTLIDSEGRCLHCGAQAGTGGCVRCNSSRLFCTCGALLSCGCGLTFAHNVRDCPSIIKPISFVLTDAPQEGKL